MIEIRHRYTGDVLHAGEYGTLRAAVIDAAARKTNLAKANLTEASLAGADLTEAYLTRAATGTPSTTSTEED